jgi:hypothetical protein
MDYFARTIHAPTAANMRTEPHGFDVSGHPPPTQEYALYIPNPISPPTTAPINGQTNFIAIIRNSRLSYYQSAVMLPHFPHN